ncbi:MAG: T9SS type A sorting domain-containing protein [Crocinitomicaceae bacterium]|nr:T9SS type A sorting domain-containing protein [Crocinitomicaceae bacterium]
MKKVLLSMLSVFSIGAFSYGQYCMPAYNSQCTSGDYINDVVMGGISNTGTGCSNPSANNYTDYTSTDSTYLGQTLTYTISVAPGPSWGQYFIVGIDFDQNGDFNGADEFFNIGYASGGTTITSSILIPATATLGTTTMRVMARYGSSALTQADLCATSLSYGETEDYKVIIDPAPTCPQPTSFTAVNGTNMDEADLSWTAGGSETEWQISYGVEGFNPANGTLSIVSTTSETVSGLSAGAHVEFYVRGICGAGDTSYWEGPVSVCIPFNVPWMDDLETTMTGAGDEPTCWTWPTGSTDWYTASAPLSYNRGAYSGNNYIYRDYSSTVSPAPVTPGIYLNTGTLYQFEMMYNTDGYNGWDSIYVQFADNQAMTSPTWIGTADDPTNTVYQKFSRVFEVPADGVYYFRLGVKSTGSPWYVSMDDFKVDLAPSCPQPYDVVETLNNQDSIAISWTAGYNETQWEIEYGETGFTIGTGSAVTNIYQSADTITNLQLGMVYDFYVRANCGAGDNSDWVGPFTFATEVTNDSICYAQPIPVDGTERVFSNIGAVVQTGEPTGYNSVWFTFVAPASESVEISTCGSVFQFDTRIDVMTIGDCGDNATWASVDYSTYAELGCSQYGAAELRVCGLTAGETYYLRISGDYDGPGLFPLTITDNFVPTAGTANDFTMCYADTVSLFNGLVGADNFGNWNDLDMTYKIINDSMLVGSGLQYDNPFEFQYVITNECPNVGDTTSVMVTISGPSHAGTGSNMNQTCNFGPVNLFDGLSGQVDLGGTWYDAQWNSLGATLIDFNGEPAGSYDYYYVVDNGFCAADTAMVTVNLYDCTGLEDMEFGEFAVYPNPTKGAFEIVNGGQADEFRIEIIDLTGKVVTAQERNLATGARIQMDLSGKERGVYFISIKSANVQKQYKLVLK